MPCSEAWAGLRPADSRGRLSPHAFSTHSCSHIYVISRLTALPVHPAVLLLVLVRSLRGRLLLDSRGLCRLGWLLLVDLGVGDPVGARIRGIFPGASFWLCGGGRSGAWVAGCRLLER